MKAYQIEYNDMMEQKDIKLALFAIHDELLRSSFASMNDVEKIRVISKVEVEIVTPQAIRHYEYNRSKNRVDYLESTSRTQEAEAQ